MTIPSFYNLHFLAPTAFSLWFGLLNCARGRLLFGMTTSTEESRVISTFFMAMASAALAVSVRPGDALFVGEVSAWAWLMLLLWCTPAWDAYWSAEIGNDPSHSRLWGLGMMTLRMLLAAPCIIGLALLEHTTAWFSLGVLTLGIPYYVSGFITPRAYVISAAETAVGMILGLLIYATLVQ